MGPAGLRLAIRDGSIEPWTTLAVGGVVGPELAEGGVVGPELAEGGVVGPELAVRGWGRS